MPKRGWPFFFFFFFFFFSCFLRAMHSPST